MRHFSYPGTLDKPLPPWLLTALPYEEKHPEVERLVKGLFGAKFDFDLLTGRGVRV